MDEDRNESDSADVSEQPLARKDRGGRPSKLTPDVVARILSGIRCGATNVDACAAAGISPSTLAHWSRRAKEPDAPQKYRRFARQLERARYEGHIARLATIQKASQTDWRAAAWLLERLDSKRFSLKHQVEHSGKLDTPVDQRAMSAILAVPGLLEQLDAIALADGANGAEGIDELLRIDFGGGRELPSGDEETDGRGEPSRADEGDP